MSQKNAVRHRVNCQIIAKPAVATVSSVPLQNKKEDAKQTLYLNRV
jgi:hypothetical protein